MAARVIHFGWDDCYRIQVLRSAGFEVREAQSLGKLSLHLERDEHVDAVVLSEDIESEVVQAAEIVRKFTVAPIIFFQRTQREIDEGRFNKVFDSSVPRRVWLGETAALIARGRALRAYSAALRAEAAEVREESQRQRERARRLCKGPAAPPRHRK